MDKVDAYDKEQLQAMGWLFDEIETPDTAMRFVEQGLTFEQQNQACANIGLNFVDISDVMDAGGVLDDTTFNKVRNAKCLYCSADGITVFLSRTSIDVADLDKVYWASMNVSGDPLTQGGLMPLQFLVLELAISTKTLRFASASGTLAQEAMTFLASNADFINRLQPVRYTTQSLTTDQQNTVLANIGLDIMVVNLTNGSATLTQAQADALLASNGVIFIGSGTEPMKNRIFFRFENEFYAVLRRSYMVYATYNPDTRVITVRDTVKILDVDSVHFTAQTLNEAQQAQARANIGVNQDFITAIASNLDFEYALANNSSFITDLFTALDREHYAFHLVSDTSLGSDLLNDADFIAELKTKLGLT